jgi:hypothetical protein
MIKSPFDIGVEHKLGFVSKAQKDGFDGIVA